MALTGLQIQKWLPKTNCKECGCSTCLAFAMKLAARKAELAECPYVSDEAREVLGAAAEPPIRTVTVGEGEPAFKAGGETVVFRHEKTFVNQTGLGLAVDDTLEDRELARRVAALRDYRLERVGEVLLPDAVSVAFKSGSPERFSAALERVSGSWDRAIAVRSDDATILSTAAERLRGRRPLLASATSATVADLVEVAKKTGAALAVASEKFDDLVALVGTCRGDGFRDVFLELRADSLCEHYQNNTVIRRAALKAGLKDLGYPILTYIDTGDPLDDAVAAGIEITKYGSLAFLPTFDPADFTPLLALRQNIFTDPQKPIQVDPQVYPVGEPDENSPVFVTTNFSLTYFIVSGEIENAGISAWLLVPECEGLSVLTAWAAGKFGGDKIGAFVKECALEDRISCRTIVIPGYVAQISGELEDALPGWEVVVGPQEAGDIESFVKNVLTR
ncbi:MAG: acetyl-CoA decarbonylase/synthase complex subunit gamma [Phycisphaerales bacterium]|nr:MAG: acetyl-CoA decarbonylase/synthase complex subunit gamma [Phycisphaerales bacterium]